MDFEVLWIVAILVFAGVEAYTSVLVSIWFAAGSAAALVTTILGAGIYTQIVVFLAVSLLSMFLLRRAALKSIKNNAESTNLDRIIGQSIVIDETVDNRQNSGNARIGDGVWKGKSKNGENIPAGATAKVVAIEGVKLIVEKMED